MMDTSGSLAGEPWAEKDASGLALARRLAGIAPKDARFRMYFRMLNTPGVSEAYIRSRGRLRHRRIQSRTRLVIEGFPSSGNTFCLQAFLLANPSLDGNDVCSHTHSPRVAMNAARRGLPCIVLIRDPRDAVSSMLQRRPGIQIGSAFRYYRKYYEGVWSVRHALTIAPFSDLVGDFSKVFERCNEYHGTQFNTGREAGISDLSVIKRIEELARNRHAGAIRELTISRPTTTREPSSVFLNGLNSREQRTLEGALEIWHEFSRR